MNNTNNTNIIAENISLREILNNLNSGLYDVNEYDNIRIFSKNKPDFIILTVEAQISSNNLIKLFENEKVDNSFKFETTFNDYVVVSKDKQESSSISLFELILSSEILNIDESDKWSLDTNDFICIEIDYVEKEIGLKMSEIDMKILG